MIHNLTDNCDHAPEPASQHVPVPTAFRVPCHRCGAIVVFPFDEVLSARLDQLLILEEWLQSLTSAKVKVEP